MYCKNCGKEMNDAAEFCANCGAKNENATLQTNTTSVGGKKVPVITIVAFALSIVGFILAWFINYNFIAELLIFVGFIVSIISLYQCFKAKGLKGFTNFFSFAFSNSKDLRSAYQLPSIAFLLSLVIMIIVTVVSAVR